MQHSSPTREAAIASNILLASFVAGLAINFFTKTGLFDEGGLSLPIWIPLIILIVVRYVFYKLKQGKLWAKIVSAVLVGFALVGSIATLARLIRSHLTIASHSELINFILQFILLLVMAGAVVYSFRKPDLVQIDEDGPSL